jgi:hypothetical protein
MNENSKQCIENGLKRFEQQKNTESILLLNEINNYYNEVVKDMIFRKLQKKNKIYILLKITYDEGYVRLEQNYPNLNVMTYFITFLKEKGFNANVYTEIRNMLYCDVYHYSIRIYDDRVIEALKVLIDNHITYIDNCISRNVKYIEYYKTDSRVYYTNNLRKELDKKYQKKFKFKDSRRIKNPYYKSSCIIV